MSWFLAIFMGFIQGLTEFIPVSSSGHLAILQHFGLENIHDRHQFFDVLLHMGTLVAVFIAYWKDIVEMFWAVVSVFKRGGGSQDRPVEQSKKRLVFLLVLGTLPLVLVFPIRNVVGQLGNHLWFIGLMLLVTGGILFCSDKIVPGRGSEKNASVKGALFVGLLQVVGTLPGISRSGITITGGLMSGFDRAFAVRFSFLLSIPAILGAYLVTLFGSLNTVDWSLMPRYLVGTVVAGVTGYFAIHLVKMLVKAGRFGKFAYYCWGLGIVTIIVSIVSGIMA